MTCTARILSDTRRNFSPIQISCNLEVYNSKILENIIQHIYIYIYIYIYKIFNYKAYYNCYSINKMFQNLIMK